MIHALTLATLVQAVLTWALFFFPPIATVAAEALGLDPIAVGYQAALMLTSMLVGTLFSGLVLARLGPVRSLQLSIAVTALGCLLYLLHSVAAIGAGSVLVGLAYGLVNPGTAMILQRNPVPGRSGLVFSVKQASVPLGFMVSSIIAPQIAVEVDWRWALLPLLAAMLAIFVALQSLMARSGSAGGAVIKGWWRAPFDAVRLALADRTLLFITLAGVSLGFCQHTAMNFSSNMMVTEHGLPVVAAGLLLSWAAAAAIAGRIGFGYLSDHISGHRMLILIGIGCTLLGGAVAAMASISDRWILLAALFILIGGFAVGWNGVMMAIIAKLSGGPDYEQKQAGAYFVLFQNALLAPLTMIILYSLSGSYTVSIATILAAGGLAAICFTLLSSRSARGG